MCFCLYMNIVALAYVPLQKRSKREMQRDRLTLKLTFSPFTFIYCHMLPLLTTRVVTQWSEVQNKLVYEIIH